MLTQVWTKDAHVWRYSELEYQCSVWMPTIRAWCWKVTMHGIEKKSGVEQTRGQAQRKVADFLREDKRK